MSMYKQNKLVQDIQIGGKIVTEVYHGSNQIYSASSNGLAYEYNSTTKSYHVTGIGTCTDTIIKLPRQYNDGTHGSLNVTHVADSAFADNTTITQFKCSNNIIKLGSQSFARCTNLQAIQLDANLQELGSGCFKGCSSLNSIDTSCVTNLTYINTYTFEGCTSLIQFVIPEGVTRISNACFKDCTALKRIYFPSTFVGISTGFVGDNMTAFYNDTALEGVYIKNLANWATSKFDAGVTSATLASDLFLKPSHNPLYYAHNLYLQDGDGNYNLITSLTLPSNITYVDACAFHGATCITSVSIPSTITKLYGAAFAKSGITSVTIPSSVTTICYAVFADCNNLSTLDYQSTQTFIPDECFRGTALRNITLSGVRAIGPGAFFNCVRLNSISGLYDSLYIGGSAFQGDERLVYLMASGGSLQILGIKKLTDPSNVRSNAITTNTAEIGYSTFDSCKQLNNNIIIDIKIATIRMHAFYNCLSLTGINFESTKTWSTSGSASPISTSDPLQNKVLLSETYVNDWTRNS